MTIFRAVARKIQRAISAISALVVAALSITAAQAQTLEAHSPTQARVVVVGEGRVTVTPDYAQIRSGVTTTAKTVKEASDTNAKLMTAILAALVDAGIAKKDIQTSQFSIEPVYASSTSAGSPKLAGYRVSNQVNVTVHQLSQIGEILDGLVKAGATDAGRIVFLVSDREKVLDQARETAIADARHKAELYSRAAGLNLGRVAWVTEGSDFTAPVPASGIAMRQQQVPIEAGETTLTATVTVGFDVAQ